MSEDKTKKRAQKAVEFEHDAIAIRTVDPHDRAYNGFQWPAETGAVIDCPDWDNRARCGNGFHALLDGIGDWSLTYRDDGMVWQVVGVIRAECVSVGADKVKFPRCRLLYRGDKNGALALILPAMVEAIRASTDAKLTSGQGENAAATGYRGHAAATGDKGHAAATGHAAIAASLGEGGTACAGAGGAITLAHHKWDGCKGRHVLAAIRSSLVGENGIEPGKTYRLTEAGEFEEVGDPK